MPTKQDITNNPKCLEDPALDHKAIYISRTKHLTDLKEKIIKNVPSSRKAWTKENIRLWRIPSFQGKEHLFKKINESLDSIKAGKLIQIENLDYLEYLPKVSLNEFDCEDTDILVVEFAENKENSASSNDSSDWIFEVPKIEMKEGKCEWCNNRKILKCFCQCKDVWYCCETCKTRDASFHEKNCKRKFEIEENNTLRMTSYSRKGLVGLQNLGNTCFMNTALQCISACYELAQYFLSDVYKKDINLDNPIGTQGVLARSYANLLKNLYYGESNAFSPRNFKRAIATFQSMFSGYQQHDTQEFLTYLLDGLHEDLNKVVKKPVVEKDDNLKEDSVKAKEQWIGFLKRNQSVLVDLLYGQYKSTIYCPCSNVSTTFDPYLSISLPLANRVQAYEITCYFIFFDLALKPIELELTFYTKTTIMALRNKIAKILEIHPMSFLVAKMDSQGNLDHLFNTKSSISSRAGYNMHPNETSFFLFQIDPKLFNSQLNAYHDPMNFKPNDFVNVLENLAAKKEEIRKLFNEDYEENEDNSTNESENYYSTSNYYARNSTDKLTIKYNVDNYNGFDKEKFLLVTLLMRGYTQYSSNLRDRNRLIFPRVFYVNKDWSLRELHRYIFDYFYPIVKPAYARLNCKDGELYKQVMSMQPEELFDHIYKNYSPSESTDSHDYQSSNKLPYTLRIKGVFSKDSRSSEREFLLPIGNPSESLRSILEKVPKNSKQSELDNTYLFMSEQQKYYSNMNSHELSLEAVWLFDYEKTVKDLNSKVDFDVRNSKRGRSSISMTECFRQFTKLEKLEENNEWYCNVCKKHTRAKIKMELYSTPPILIIHLKRFKNNTKIDTLVDFPIKDLDMSEYLLSPDGNKNNKYDLFGVSNHYGGMGGGHYVAYAKNYFDNRWYTFNDSSVSSMDESQIVSSSAYVLFYRNQRIKDLDLEKIYNKSFVEY